MENRLLLNHSNENCSGVPFIKIVCLPSCTCTYVGMCVCMYVCMHACMYVPSTHIADMLPMCVCVYMCMYACVYVCICVYVCMYVRMYIYSAICCQSCPVCSHHSH